ncbi:uncharacterized protein At4g38062-like [Chenopodium quinoa]|uniref:Uncharacterized protein n=1 Tax=Chenopodium quinoa TaxID=63459 RepID=A0A803KXA6_CHEQI|nr:uncharacterized protein At4g38062-like [Chenopodium quinoa]XP_021714006.1 uncharacterized protein At4g38062-like [Chenopodium quinoa]
MGKELEEAKAEIERLKCSLEDKDYIIKTQWDETKTLKTLVSELQKKEKEDVKSPVNNQEGDLLEELVERHRKVEDELKWKVEQFKHLEEAYEKLRDQFRTSKTEWETEKSSLVDEISKLQESFDDENRAAEGLKYQLAMCKQALENEESRRKKLEEQVSEMKLSLESVAREGFGGKMEGGCLAVENGEEEVANLRHSLRVKEMDLKDMEYKANKLEKENQELLTSIKELQEAHIPRAIPTSSSWAKLKTRLKSLELSHKECSANLKAKEAEWSSKADRMDRELERCSSNLKSKDQVIEELKKELEGCNSSLTQLKMQNEELSLMLQLMQSEGSENTECGTAQLMEQLEKIRGEKLGMQEDLDKLREELEELREALDVIDSELTDQTNERNGLEYELQDWISIAAHLEMQVIKGQAMRRDLELSLLEQAEVEEMLKIDTEEKDRRIGNLEQQIYLMDQEIRIEEDDTTEEDEKVSPRMQLEDEQLQLELLARELEEAVVVHIMEERDYSFDQSSQEDMEPAEMHERMVVQGFDDNKIRISLEGEDICASKENASQRHSHLRKTSESLIEGRSPFRELN